MIIPSFSEYDMYVFIKELLKLIPEERIMFFEVLNKW